MTATLTTTVTDDLEWVEAGFAAVDPESDVGFFSMSPARAEQVTVQIRSVLDRAWEFIALAYKGRAFLALGYGSWDEYVDARFGDLRLAVPREHRTQVVATLAGARMSVRAIAKLLDDLAGLDDLLDEVDARAKELQRRTAEILVGQTNPYRSDREPEE